MYLYCTKKLRAENGLRNNREETGCNRLSGNPKTEPVGISFFGFIYNRFRVGYIGNSMQPFMFENSMLILNKL